MTLIPGIHFPTNREEPVSRDALSLDVGCAGGLDGGRLGGGGLDPFFNVCPAVTYSPTPSRVQYHRRCGS